MTASSAFANTNIKRIALLTIGFGCLIGYSRMASLGFTGYLDGGMTASTDDWYALRTAASLCTLVALALGGLFGRFKIGLPASFAAAGIAVAGILVHEFTPFGLLAPLGAALTGFSMAMLMYAWLMALSTLGKPEVAVVTGAGLLVGGCAIYAAGRIGGTLAAVIGVGAVLVASLTLIAAKEGMITAAEPGRLSKEQAARIPWFTIVAFSASGFIATFEYGVAGHLTLLYDWQPNYVAFATAALAAIVATYGMMLTLDTWKQSIWTPQMLVVVLALALSCFSLRETVQGAVGFMLAAVLCAHFLHWAVFPCILAECDAPNPFLAALMLLLVNASVGSIAGNAAGSLLPHSMQNLGGVAGLSVIALVLVLAATQFACAKLFGPADQADPVQQSPLDALEARIGEITAEYGLTPRESEVAMLTAQGYSIAYIAEKLVVSHSTVRFHQQNLFRKLDVHSRNEFIDRIAHPSEAE